jgi:hypothetical protein
MTLTNLRYIFENVLSECINHCNARFNQLSLIQAWIDVGRDFFVVKIDQSGGKRFSFQTANRLIQLLIPIEENHPNIELLQLQSEGFLFFLFLSFERKRARKKKERAKIISILFFLSTDKLHCIGLKKTIYFEFNDSINIAKGKNAWQNCVSHFPN